MKALIIDKDANFLFGLEIKLSTLGLEAETHSGIGEPEDLINRIKTEMYDFIIVDPEFLNKNDDFNLLEKIKSEDETSRIPVFVFTNSSEESFKNKVLNLGANYYFSKDNIDIDNFVVKVLKILANRRKISERRHCLYLRKDL